MIALVNANALQIPLADESCHMVVTSPPYYALRQYSGTAKWVGGDEGCDHKRGVKDSSTKRVDGGVPANNNHAEEGWIGGVCGKCGAVRIDGQLGLEKKADCGAWSRGKQEPYIAWHIEDDEPAPYIAWRPTEEVQLCGSCYICQMVAVFREVRRVLRDDGIVFCNIGDSYAGGERGRGDKGFAGEKQATNNGSVYLDAMIPQDNMKPKDMLLIPQRLALALQADGWWIRSEIIWHKPNPMPESVTDRPTKSHETIWLMSKSARYFWDAEAVREKANDEEIRYRVELRTKNAAEYEIKMPYQNNFPNGGRVTGGRNMRDVWTFPTQNYSGAHYATYPEALVERCIRAGTSERGVCPKCGSQWVRVVEKQRPPKCVFTDTTNPQDGIVNGGGAWNGGGKGAGQKLQNWLNEHPPITTGFSPSCSCNLDPIPATILDPFAGSGTTLLVAKRMGRSAIGLDLSYQYLRENAWQRVQMNAPRMV